MKTSCSAQLKKALWRTRGGKKTAVLSLLAIVRSGICRYAFEGWLAIV